MALSVSFLLLSSCQNNSKGKFTVTGTFKNADRLGLGGLPLKVYLQEISYGKDQAPVSLDSAKLSGSNGSFTLSCPGKLQGVYELVFGEGILALPLIDDASEIKVDVDLGKKDDFYEVSQSDASNKLKDMIIIFGKKNFEVERRFAELDSLKRSGAPDSIQISATNAKNAAIDELNTYLKQFINTSDNATVSVLALGWANQTFSTVDFQSSLKELVKKFPDNTMVLAMKKEYEQQLAQQQAQMAEMEKKQKDNSWIGKDAPALALPDQNGKIVSIASYKGKYLLVDFWASWCGPCRGENPNVVKAYNEFKGKNFAILGVSLDKEKEPWQQAIQDDKLTWTHVSDLKFWNSKAVETFKFEGIPYNVLIDPQGKVIAESLRGEDLENKLKEVLN
jgi:peroxiredoxin